jgi:hypothetical protein
MQFVLRSFNRSVGIFTDVSVTPNASFQTVPGQLPYAGSGTGGFEILPGSTATVTTDFEGNVTIAWEAFAVRLATGSLIDYGAGTFDDSIPQVGPWYIYVDDPTFSGGADKVAVSDSGLPTLGTGVFVVTASFGPRLPSHEGTTRVITLMIG